MFSLLKKEIQSFLGSLIGYIVIIVFLTIMSLIMWVFPSDYNILDNESEDLEFEISYFMIEKDLITLSLDFYSNDETQNDAIWIYKKQVKIETKELLERIEILTSYE